MNPEKTITIKEIAKSLKVSVSTVSRALNDHPSISAETRKRIQKFADENNYQKNFAAIQFKTGRSLSLGVILPEIKENFFSQAISAIEDVSLEKGYNVFFAQSHDLVHREKGLLEHFLKNRIDGLVVSLSKNTMNINHFVEFQKKGIPVVFFDRIPKEEEAYTVSCDLYAASQNIIDFLWERGHKDIALLKGPSSMRATKERMRGFMEGLNKKRVKTDASLFASTDLTKESTWKAMKDILSQKRKPTAVVAFNDYVALDAIQYVRLNTDLQINKDILFISYANLPISQYLVEAKPIASIEQFPYEQGKLATKMLFDIIDGKKKLSLKERHIVLEGELKVHSKS